jgi:hypothetical protein
MFGYLLVPLASPVVFWMGVRSWGPTVAALVTCVVCIVLTLMVSRMRRPTESFMFLVFTLSCAMVAFLTPEFGPFFGMPNALGIATVVFCAHAKRRGRLFAMACLALAAAWLLPLTGLVSPSYAFTEEGTLAILPVATSFPPIPTTLHLIIISLATTLIPGFLIGRLRDGLTRAQQHVLLQSWQLKQLVS